MLSTYQTFGFDVKRSLDVLHSDGHPQVIVGSPGAGCFSGLLLLRPGQSLGEFEGDISHGLRRLSNHARRYPPTHIVGKNLGVGVAKNGQRGQKIRLSSNVQLLRWRDGDPARQKNLVQ